MRCINNVYDISSSCFREKKEEQKIGNLANAILETQRWCVKNWEVSSSPKVLDQDNVMDNEEQATVYLDKHRQGKWKRAKKD